MDKVTKFQKKLLELDEKLESCSSDYVKEAVEFQGELDLAVMDYKISVADYEQLSKENIENTTYFQNNCKCFRGSPYGERPFP